MLANKRYLIIACIALLCGSILIFKVIRNSTTLSFNITLDGKSLSAGVAPVVKLDGQLFTSGCTLNPGRHVLVIELQNAEPKTNIVWVFIGNKDLGDLPLELIKGSMQISVRPTPASIIVRRGTEIIKSGDSFISLEKLPYGFYDVDIKRGEYKERHQIRIQGKMQVETNLILNLGSVYLSAIPTNASYVLLGNGQRWQGELPAIINYIPCGVYNMTATSKGWSTNNQIIVVRGNTETNIIDFPYGAIDISSDPNGMTILVNGEQSGKSPVTLYEIKPGPYSVLATDGINDFITNIKVGPKETVRCRYLFHYGTVQLSSIPSGATVIRRGKTVGKTPITLERVPTVPIDVQLENTGYLTTNASIYTQEFTSKSIMIKMVSERYNKAINESRVALDSNQYDVARKAVATAIESDPGNTNAAALLAEINQKSEIWSRRQIEIKRIADEKESQRLVAELTDTPTLDPESVIAECLKKSGNKFSKFNTADAAKNGVAGVPVAVAADAIVKSIELTSIFVKKLVTPKESLVDQPRFSESFKGKKYKYYGEITSSDDSPAQISFITVNKLNQVIYVTVLYNNTNASNTGLVKVGAKVWLSGKLNALEEEKSYFKLVLDNSTLYSPSIIPATVVDNNAQAVENQNYIRYKTDCINNLRQIDAAAYQWSLEEKKKKGDDITEANVKTYIKLDANGNMPKCPAGGKYSFGKVGESPTCSFPGHVLP